MVTLTHTLVALILKEQRPRGFRILEREGAADPIDGSVAADGKCHWDEKVLSVAPITTLYGLGVVLHEIAHAKFHRETRLAEWAMEYEAEQWAFRTIRNYGLRPTLQMREEARLNVRKIIERDNPPNVPPKVRKWVRYKSPKVVWLKRRPPMT